MFNEINLNVNVQFIIFLQINENSLKFENLIIILTFKLFIIKEKNSEHL
jgi:hypothetical protein